MLLPLSPLHAADIYRWVDENGQTHLSDTVPDKYRNSATRVDPGPEPTPQQREEAEARAAQQKKRADEEAQRRAREAPDAGGGTAPAAPAPAIKPAPPAPPATTSDSNCAELLRRYRESQECFAPYRMANGAIRPEGFQLCGPDVADPSGRCVRVNPD
jgi:hypothetical protein